MGARETESLFRKTVYCSLRCWLDPRQYGSSNVISGSSQKIFCRKGAIGCMYERKMSPRYPLRLLAWTPEGWRYWKGNCPS